MLISRTWLQSYTKTELPNTQDIAQHLMLHAFEIEGVVNDDLIDIDVLPNRAHDCLCHQGIAQELLGILKIDHVDTRYPENTIKASTDAPTIRVENTESCRRYTAYFMNNVKVEASPVWLRESLESINQKSINNIVDATNYVMFDLGQPLHAFDADKVVGDIVVRNAQEGEEMTTLSGEELVLSSTDLVIADDEGVLALAGIKGGIKAQVDEATTNIIIEAANFNPLTTRITSRKVKINTDSSKRFENELHPSLVSEVYPKLQVLLQELAGTETTSFSKIYDTYHHEFEPKTITVSHERIEKILGLSIPSEEIENIFKQFDMNYENAEGGFKVLPSLLRLDLNIQEDIIEEIGRWYGYHNIPSKPLEEITFTPRIHSTTYYAHALRNLLLNEGYSEVYTYSFVKKGEVQVRNPIGSNKQSLRSNIEKQLAEALEKNLKNASFLGIDVIRLFEIGTVYSAVGEDIRCSIAVATTDKKSRKKYGVAEVQLENIINTIEKQFKVRINLKKEGDVCSFSLNDLMGNLKIEEYGPLFDEETYPSNASFKNISIYPYSTRDISLWVDEEVSSSEVLNNIKEVAGEYLVKSFLFDEFNKEGRTSYAFSLVFQSQEKTLEDSDVDTAMANINTRLKECLWEVR